MSHTHQWTETDVIQASVDRLMSHMHRISKQTGVIHASVDRCHTCVSGQRLMSHASVDRDCCHTCISGQRLLSHMHQWTEHTWFTCDNYLLACNTRQTKSKVTSSHKTDTAFFASVQTTVVSNCFCCFYADSCHIYCCCYNRSLHYMNTVIKSLFWWRKKFTKFIGNRTNTEESRCFNPHC